MMIIGGSASNGLDILLSKALGADLTKVETTKFPDGEMKVKVPEVNEGEVAIVQSTYYPQERHIFELLLTAHALKDSGVNITAVVPYLAYARQNRSFTQGEAVSINTVLDMLYATGVKRLVTVNPHRSGALMHFKGKVCAVDAIKTLAESVGRHLESTLVLAPDKGGLNLAKSAAAVLKCDYTYIEKERDNYGNVSVKRTHGGDFNGRNVVIFDDIISTGGTVALAARFAYSEGASSVSAAGIHLVMAGDAHERMRNAGVTNLFSTNTIPCEKANVADVSGDIAECIVDFKKRDY